MTVVDFKAAVGLDEGEERRGASEARASASSVSGGGLTTICTNLFVHYAMSMVFSLTEERAHDAGKP